MLNNFLVVRRGWQGEVSTVASSQKIAVLPLDSKDNILIILILIFS